MKSPTDGGSVEFLACTCAQLYPPACMKDSVTNYLE